MTDNIADLARRLTELCIDWTGEPIVDGSTPRIEPDCGLLREAAQALTRIARERDALLSGETAVLPHTRKHAEDLYTVAVACLKTYGVDAEARAQAAEAERDRLRAALITIRDSFAPDSIVGARPDLGFHGFKGFKAVAREALGETQPSAS